MKMKKYFGSATAAVSALMLCGCTANFDHFNKDPNAASEEESLWGDARTGAMFLQMQQNVLVVQQSGASIGTDRYQTVEVMGGDSFIGYFGSGNANHNSASRYNWNQASWYGDMFTTNFTRTMSAYAILADALDENEPRLAMAKIIKVAAMHRVVESYGPIPYIYFDGVSVPYYDSQEDIYDTFFEELEDAVETLIPYAQTGESIFSDWDAVYMGDVSKWVMFANSLRLRLAMHISMIAPQKAQTQAENAVSNAGGLLVSATNEARLNHTGRLSTYESPLTVITGWNDVAMGATIDAYMNGYDDPRLSNYFNTNNSGNYSGIRGGLPASANKSDFTAGDYSEINTDMHEDVVWMKASETYFLLAEGALNGWSMGGTAQDFYEEGIRLSFDERGASGADAYIANSTAVPAAYVDPLGRYSANAPSTVTIAWNNGDGDDLKREKILTQKYIAMFPNGQEAWTEHRRTGYPKVILPVNNENSSVPDDTIIRRLMYPEDEYNTNRERVDAAVPSLLGGADNCGTRLWWDVGN